MIFFLFQLSICKQVYDFTIRDRKNLLLYIDKYDIIEVVSNKGDGVFFSSWNNFSNLTIEIFNEYPIGSNEPLQICDSNSELVGLYFKDKNIILRITNEGEVSYKLFIWIYNKLPRVERDSDKIPDGFTMPIFSYVKNYKVFEFDQLFDSFLYNNDSTGSKCKIMLSLTDVFLLLCCLIYILAHCKLISR